MFRNAISSAPRMLSSRAFSTTRPSALSRINLIGRLVSSPEVRESRNGKEYLRYVVATQDPLGPPNEDGTPAQPTTSFHSIFAFGEGPVNRMRDLPKGTQLYVEADFRVTRTPGEGDIPPQDQWLVQHRNYKVINRPRNQESA